MNEEEKRAMMRAAGIGALVFVAVMAFGGPRWMGMDAEDSPLVGQVAPDFGAEIAAGEGAGDRITIAGLRGHVVMLDFWASWCPPCRESLPILGRVAARHPDVQAFAVNVESEQPRERVVAAHRALGIAIPTLLDRDQAAQSAFDVVALPTLVLVDRDGIVRHVSRGVPDEADLDARLDALSH
jgi:thiol-disulfide isomerase/thioredoxin